MDAPVQPNTRRIQLYGWALFLLVVGVATWLVGPLALLIALMVVGVALIVSGVKASGWPRPALIVIGIILATVPIFFLADVVLGGWQVNVR